MTFGAFSWPECLEAYAELDEAQKERLQALLHTEAYQEVGPLMKTTYERGIERGIERDVVQGERRSALRQMFDAQAFQPDARLESLTYSIQHPIARLSRAAS